MRRLGAVAAATLAVAGVGSTPGTARAEAPAPKRLRAEPARERIVIDGRLSEPAWSQAAVGTDFVERSPSPGEPAPPGHQVRVLFDRDALYVGVRLPLGPGERPRALELSRDSFGIFDDDAVSLKIDVRRDQRTTVGFVTNAAGAQLDYIALENGKQFRREYDAVWQVATLVEVDAWTAEFRLPVAALGVPDGNGARILGLNVTRDHSARAATYDWAAMPPEFGAFTALYYGEVDGVQDLGGGRPLVLIPYVLARYDTEGTDGLRLQTEDVATFPGDPGRVELAVGGDVQLRLLEDLWSELTILPDFAQVDLDDPVVNFDRFPLFFPERRAFFLAGLQVFEFGVPQVNQLFFSRRIGLDDSGNEIPVLTGLKIYGTAGPWQMGLFQVLTGREVLPADDAPDTVVSAASWSVLRLRRNFSENANLGVLGTLRGDLGDEGASGGGFQPDGSVGLDGTLRLVDRRLELTGFWAYTNNAEDEGRATGHSARVAAAYRGELLQPSASVLLVEENYDPAVGFVRRQDILQTDVNLNYVRRPRGDQDLQVSVGVSGQALRAANRDVNLGQSVTLSTGLRWRSGWRIDADGSYVEDLVEDEFELLGARTVEADRYRGVRTSVGIDSPSVRNPSFGASYAVDTSFFGGVRHGPSVGVVASAGPHFRMSADADLSFSSFDDGFSTEALTVNSRFTVAPTTTLNSDLIVQLNTIAEVITGLHRIRWRYLPGSDLFLVSRYERRYGEGEDRFDITLKVQIRFDLLL